MANNRVHYAIKQFAVKNNASAQTRTVLPLSSSGVNPSGFWEVPRGVQSTSLSTTFDLEQVFEMGKLGIYENVENIPDVEITVNRVIDGTMPLYLIGSDETNTTLLGRNENYKVDLALNIFPDTQTSVSEGGSEVSAVYMSGMFLSALTYTFPVDGNFTEEITFVGNDKFWADVTDGTGSLGIGVFPSGVIQDNEDPTVNVGNLDGVQRRENFDIPNTTLPNDIPGVTAGLLAASGECLQTVTVTLDLGREDILCLGEKSPFFRFVTIPVEVTTTIEAITKQGDLVEADSSIDNLVNQTIILKTTSGLSIDLGTSNKLSSVEMAGGDAGAGQETTSFTYTNANDFTLTHANYS